MSTKFTPGPWRVESCELVNPQYITSPVAYVIEGQFMTNLSRANRAANERLIAAAPTMLETLKSVHKSLEVLAKAALTGKRSEEFELLCLLMLQMEETMKRAEGNE